MQLTESPRDLTRYVAAEVRAAMARRQISQQALADAVGWTQAYLARRLVGRVPFDVSDLEKLGEFLDVPVTSFLPVKRAS